VIDHEGQGHDHREKNQDPPGGAGRAEIKFMDDRGEKNDGCARNGRQNAADNAQAHQQQSHGKSDHLLHGHAE
jgi:hypothetical protein